MLTFGGDQAATIFSYNEGLAPMAIENFGAILELPASPCYQLNCTANSAHMANFCGKWAGLAVLFSWQLQIMSKTSQPSLQKCKQKVNNFPESPLHETKMNEKSVKFFDKSVDKRAFLKITNLYAPTFPNHSYHIHTYIVSINVTNGVKLGSKPL